MSVEKVSNPNPAGAALSGQEASGLEEVDIASPQAFLTHLRHELRTPLNAIIGYAEMLQEDAEDSGYEQAIAELQQIHTTGKQLLALVNDLLSPLKIEAEGLELNVRELQEDLCRQLQPLVGHVIDSSGKLTSDAKAACRDDMCSDLERIHSSALRFLSLIDDASAFAGIGAEASVPGETTSSLVSLEGAAQEGDFFPDDLCRALERGRLLVVDDNEMNRDLLSRYLRRQGHTVELAEHGLEALEMIGAGAFDLVLLDIMMPGMDGYEVCRRLKSAGQTRDIPVLFLSAMAELKDKTLGFQVGAVDYITKPFDFLEVKARVETHLSLAFARKSLANQNAILEERVRERTREIAETQKEIIIRLGLATEVRDTDTGMHVRRIQGYTMVLAERCGLSREESELLALASTLHDIGKIGIPDNILLKPGRLDDAEMTVMKTHTTVGARSLENSNARLIEMARITALTHHERWDGKGYPQGLAGEDIPLAGRIVCIADVFDALTAKRPYKDAWPVEKAVRVIKEGSGTQFDPGLIEIFMDCLPQILAVRQEFSDGA